MNLTRKVRCHIQMESRWAHASAVCMGLSVFLRSVYYFGLTNLNDLSGFDLSAHVIFPIILASGFLFMMKGLRVNSPILFGGLIAAYAINYMIIMDGSIASIVGAVLLVVTAVLFVVTAMGYFSNRLPLIMSGFFMLVFRVTAVDLFMYILPLDEFRPMSYLPEASNFFVLAAIAMMCAALQLKPLHRTVDLGHQNPSEEEHSLFSEEKFDSEIQPEH